MIMRVHLEVNMQGKSLFFGYFSLCTHFLWHMKHAIHVRYLENLNCVFNHLPNNFWTFYKCLVHYQIEDYHSH